jgi:crotonobetainyl-CoA:carnitine CoA-transferase CaiB-like acyl-CoA transferase
VILTDTLKWILGVAGSIALLSLIISGIMYITSTGDQQKATKAKIAIKWTLAGLILILLSYSILVVIDSIFT